MLKKLALVNDIWYFLHEYGKNFSSRVTTHAPTKYQSNSTWCQSVVPKDAPRDFDPEVAFGAKFQIPVARQGGREAEKWS